MKFKELIAEKEEIKQMEEEEKQKKAKAKVRKHMRIKTMDNSLEYQSQETISWYYSQDKNNGLDIVEEIRQKKRRIKFTVE